MAVNIKNLTDTEYFFGHKACGGCGGSLAVRLGLKVFGPRTYTAMPASCMSTVGFIFPHMPVFTNAMVTPFPAAAAVMSGMEAGAKALGIQDYHVLGFAGDGGTADIGLQALSGAIDRGDRITYICYDNEAYMNTGVQKSGLTPYGTKTTTSPAGANLPGSIRPKKNLFEIVAAHDIPYAATASIGYPQDYLNKLEKAKNTPGTSFIHVLSPCPTGWGSEPEITVELGREAVDTGLWMLAEYEDGEYILNNNPKEFLPIRTYLQKQGRFKHLTDENVAVLEKYRDYRWAKIRSRWRLPGGGKK